MNENELYEFYGEQPKIEFVSPKSLLKINEGFIIYTQYPIPNRWIRFWQRVFFGFKWEKL